MTVKKIYFTSALILLALLCLLASGCRRAAVPTLTEGVQRVEKLFSEGKMLHAKQVVEFYDEQGNPIPHYYELWLAKNKALCRELDDQGNILQKMQDDGDMHIGYDPGTLKAVKHEHSRIFTLSPESLTGMKRYKASPGEGYEYCGRTCRVYGMSNGRDEDDLRLYIDEETGYALFCDAPLFCIKTASLEVLPFDSALFRIPENLKYE